MDKKADAVEWIQKGRNLLAQKKNEKAKLKYIRALQMDRNNPFSYHGVGTIYLREESRTKSQEDLNKAVIAFTKSIKLNANISRFYQDLGVA